MDVTDGGDARERALSLVRQHYRPGPESGCLMQWVLRQPIANEGAIIKGSSEIPVPCQFLPDQKAKILTELIARSFADLARPVPGEILRYVSPELRARVRMEDSERYEVSFVSGCAGSNMNVEWRSFALPGGGVREFINFHVELGSVECSRNADGTFGIDEIDGRSIHLAEGKAKKRPLQLINAVKKNAILDSVRSCIKEKCSSLWHGDVTVNLHLDYKKPSPTREIPNMFGPFVNAKSRRGTGVFHFDAVVDVRHVYYPNRGTRDYSQGHRA